MPEMVVKRAWPYSSRLMSLGSPMGFSGDFSREVARVFSPHCCSEAEGWRPSSKRSATGDSLRDFPVGLVLSGMCYPTVPALGGRCSLVDAKVGSKGAMAFP